MAEPQERRKGMIELEKKVSALEDRTRMLEELERAAKKSRENMHKQIAEIKCEGKTQTEELKNETKQQTQELKNFVSTGFKAISDQFQAFNKNCKDCSNDITALKADYQWLYKAFKWASSVTAGAVASLITMSFKHHDKIVK